MQHNDDFTLGRAIHALVWVVYKPVLGKPCVGEDICLNELGLVKLLQDTFGHPLAVLGLDHRAIDVWQGVL